MKNLFKKDKGFTLIEVVIVLAIAGLIFVIVFLAVGAAQRSRRDNERRAAVSRLLAAAEQDAANEGGSVPTDCNDIGTAYSAGNYACSDSTTLTADNVHYEDGTNCTGGTSSRFARARINLETGGATYCEDND